MKVIALRFGRPHPAALPAKVTAPCGSALVADPRPRCGAGILGE